VRYLGLERQESRQGYGPRPSGPRRPADPAARPPDPTGRRRSGCRRL